MNDLDKELLIVGSVCKFLEEEELVIERVNFNG